ncbi:hypothetical protein [Psychrobacter sp. SMN/5/1215-MNA-CIBAN-0208]|uniref:hypothetical protein n=1 Tax=Psychrobacter sp. SMN/5/1215-MNA-CIBAN-0208 TaxID=3140442 RepID=UPI0033308F30
MNIKLSITLLTVPVFLYGCATTEVKPGSHLLNLPMSRDFIMDSPNNFQEIDAKGNKKISSIKPTGNIQPRAVVLLEKSILPSSGWKPLDFSFNVKRKNIDICKGFMSLTPVEIMEIQGRKTGNIPESDRNNHLVSYMPARGINRNNLPQNPEGCSTFLSKSYDYVSSSEELSFILGDKKLGKSPYLALYQAPTSPYSSMILSLGSLSPESITYLSSNWSELMRLVYSHGDSIDPTIGIAVMLSQDPQLNQAEKEAMKRNIKLAVRGAKCGADVGIVAIPASTTGPATIFIALGAFVKAPSCRQLVKDTAHTLGYEEEIPDFT